MSEFKYLYENVKNGKGYLFNIHQWTKHRLGIECTHVNRAIDHVKDIIRLEIVFNRELSEEEESKLSDWIRHNGTDSPNDSKTVINILDLWEYRDWLNDQFDGKLEIFFAKKDNTINGSSTDTIEIHIKDGLSPSEEARLKNVLRGLVK